VIDTMGHPYGDAGPGGPVRLHPDLRALVESTLKITTYEVGSAM
jgi:hypothetical protein